MPLQAKFFFTQRLEIYKYNKNKLTGAALAELKEPLGVVPRPGTQIQKTDFPCTCHA